MNASFSWYFGFLVLLLAISGSTALSEPKPKPNFSGSWLLDQQKSTDSGLTGRPDLPMKIVHQDPEFRVTRSYDLDGQIAEGTFVYFTDRRSERNDPAPGWPATLKDEGDKSHTKWNGNKIVIRKRLSPLDVGGVVIETERLTEYEISDDGKVLTQTIRINFLPSRTPVQNTTPNRKLIYNRV